MEMFVELYCSVDDFWKDFNKHWEQKKFSGKRCFHFLILALAVCLLIFGVNL